MTLLLKDLGIPAIVCKAVSAAHKKVLEKIVDKFNGEFFEESHNAATNRFLHGFNGLGAVKGVFRSTGGMTSNPCSEDSLDSVKTAHELGLKIKQKYSFKFFLL